MPFILENMPPSPEAALAKGMIFSASVMGPPTHMTQEEWSKKMAAMSEQPDARSGGDSGQNGSKKTGIAFLKGKLEEGLAKIDRWEDRAMNFGENSAISGIMFAIPTIALKGAEALTTHYPTVSHAFHQVAYAPGAAMGASAIAGFGTALAVVATMPVPPALRTGLRVLSSFERRTSMPTHDRDGGIERYDLQPSIEV